MEICLKDKKTIEICLMNKRNNGIMFKEYKKQWKYV